MSSSEDNELDYLLAGVDTVVKRDGDGSLKLGSDALKKLAEQFQNIDVDEDMRGQSDKDGNVSPEFNKLWSEIFPRDILKDGGTVSEVIQFLRDHEDPNMRSQLWRQRGDSPLHTAIKKGHEKIALSLIQFYPLEAFKGQDAQGNTALHLAAFFRMGRLIRAMFKRINELDPGKKSFYWFQCTQQKNAKKLTPLDCYNAAEGYARFVEAEGENSATEIVKKRFNRLLTRTLSVKKENTQKGEYEEKEIVKKRDWNAMDALLLNPSEEKLQQSLRSVLAEGKVHLDDFDLEEDEEIEGTLSLPLKDYDVGRLLKEIMLDGCKDKESPYKKHILKNHFTSGNLLDSTKDFLNKLDVEYANLKSKGTDKVKLNKAANALKSEVYQAILDKQETVREQRWKTAWILTGVGFLLPGISHLAIWGWYFYHRVNEPLRLQEISSTQFLGVYDKKGGMTARDMLSALEQKEPVREKNEQLRARRTVLPGKTAEVEIDIESDDVSLFDTVQIISTNWNKQAKRMAEKVAAFDKKSDIEYDLG